MTTAQDQQSRAEFEAHCAASLPRSLTHLPDGELTAYGTVGLNFWQAARALPAGDDALLPIAAKSHGAWDGLEDLLALPDGTEVYTAAQVQAMGRVPSGWQAVPVELSPAMKREAMDLLMDGIDLYTRGETVVVETAAPSRLWRAMLAAARRPPAP